MNDHLKTARAELARVIQTASEVMGYWVSRERTIAQMEHDIMRIAKDLESCAQRIKMAKDGKRKEVL